MQQSPRRLNLLSNHLSQSFTMAAAAGAIPKFKLTYLPVRARGENIRCVPL